MVATKFLADVSLTDKERTEVIPLVKHFHTSARNLSERYAIKLSFKGQDN